MNVLGHYLDMSTGKELPVVLARVAAVDEGEKASLVVSGQVSHVRFDPGELWLEAPISRPVVLEFVKNPAYVGAFRQMRSAEFEGPQAFPVVIMIGADSNYPCEMIPVTELHSTWK